MTIYTLSREQYLPIPVAEAWKFFSSAGNLATITPPDMQFTILTKLDDSPIRKGMHIDYIVKPLLGIPLKWRTEISEVNSPHSFTDKQLSGPYALWEHTHTFEAVAGGVRMTDEVKYALPLGILGVIAHSILVKKKLEHIFNYRKTVLEELFGKYKKR